MLRYFSARINIFIKIRVCGLFVHTRKTKMQSPIENVDTRTPMKRYEFSLNDAVLTYFSIREGEILIFTPAHIFIGRSTQPDQNISFEYLITSISLSCRWLALTAMYIIYKEDL